jgi:hypothetical protein
MTDTLDFLTLRALRIASRDHDASVRRLARDAIREWRKQQRRKGVESLNTEQHSQCDSFLVSSPCHGINGPYSRRTFAQT